MIGTRMRFHHVGIATADIAKVASDYERMLGIGPSTAVTVDELQKVRVAFAPLGEDTFLEFVEPLGPGSPVDRIVARGGGPYHVCFAVADLAEAIREARDRGAVLVSPPTPAAAFGGRRVAFLAFSGGNLVELLET